MILLDTHVLVWLDSGSDRLGPAARSRIDAAFRDSGVGVSAISFWEIATLVAKARLEIASDLSAWRRELLDSGLQELPVDGRIGLHAASVNEFHADPADRIIVSTALIHAAELSTADERILGWMGSVDRHDASR